MQYTLVQVEGNLLKFTFPYVDYLRCITQYTVFVLSDYISPVERAEIVL